MGDVGFCEFVQFLPGGNVPGGCAVGRQDDGWCLPRGCYSDRYHLAKSCGRAETGFHGKTVPVGCVFFSRHVRKMAQEQVEEVGGLDLTSQFPRSGTDRASSRNTQQRRT